MPKYICSAMEIYFDPKVVWKITNMQRFAVEMSANLKKSLWNSSFFWLYKIFSNFEVFFSKRIASASICSARLEIYCKYNSPFSSAFCLFCCFKRTMSVLLWTFCRFPLHFLHFPIHFCSLHSSLLHIKCFLLQFCHFFFLGALGVLSFKMKLYVPISICIKNFSPFCLHSFFTLN